MLKINPPIKNVKNSICLYCDKSYIKKTSLEKHQLVCSIIYKSKRELKIEEEERQLAKLTFKKKTKAPAFEVGASLEKMQWGFNKSTDKVDSPFTKRSNASFRNVASKGSSGGGSSRSRSNNNQEMSDGFIDQFPIVEEDEEIDEDL